MRALTFPTLAIGNYLAIDRRHQSIVLCDNQLFVQTSSERLRAGQSRCRRDGAPCRCCSPTGTARARATCASVTTATTTATTARARSSCGHVDGATAPAEYTAADGWQRCASWAWASPATTLPATAMPDYFLTSQGDNKLQVLADGPAAAELQDIALDMERRPIGRTRATRSALDRLACRVPGRQQRRPDRPVRHQGQRRGDARVRRARIRTTCCSADRMARLSRARPRRARRLRPRTRRSGRRPERSTACSTWLSSTRRENVRLYRNVGTGPAAQPGRLGNWLAAEAQQARRQPRRDRWLDRGPSRRTRPNGAS